MIASIVILLLLGQAFAGEPVESEEEEIVITADRPPTASSDQTIRDKDLKYFPKATASDLMRIVPGLHITQHTGGAKAHQIFLRGFDAEHGQDIRATLDGIPINEVSHVHGQGYLDLHFLIPEVVERIRIIKGPYDSHDGNFATAGSIHFSTFPQRDYTVAGRVRAGMFETYSGLAEFWLGYPEQTFGLVLQGNHTDGFSDPGQLDALRVFARAHWKESNGWTMDALYAGYLTRSQAADILPESWIQQDRIGRFEALDESNRVDVDRHLVGLTLKGPAAEGQLLLRAYYNFKDTRIFSNYSFYYFNEQYGDQLEQSDFRHYGGLETRYSFLATWPNDIALSTEIGLQYRMDAIWQTQANTVLRVRFNVMNHYRIREHNLGFFVQENLILGERWMLVGGIRYDLNLVSADGTQDIQELDIYTNKVVLRNDQPVDALVDAHAVSPKISASYVLSDEWQFFGNFGRGFVTRAARDQANRERAFSSSVTGAELGARWTGWAKRVSVSGGIWWMHKASELVFDSEFGGTVPRGQSHRVGAELELRYQPTDWIWIATDFFYLRGRLDTSSGWEPIPNAPDLLMTNVIGIRHPDGYHATIRGRLVGPRTHDLGLISDAQYLVDLVLAYETPHFEISVEMDNLFNTDWYDSVFAYPSRPDPLGPIDTGLQVTPGTPFSFRATVAFKI